MLKKKHVILCIGLIFFFSCSKKNRFDINTSNIDLKLEIKRLDKDIFETSPDELAGNVPSFIEKYENFFELYNYRIINLGDPYKKEYPLKLTGFVTDYTMNRVYERIKERFTDSYVKDMEAQIENAFKRYKYFFPGKKIPAIYTYHGGFNQSIVVADSILGVGLDKYLGSDCEFYDKLGMANYLQQNMNPANIPTDLLRAWTLTEFVYNDSKDNLVNNLIYHGKIYYLIDALFPEVSDTLKIGFTANQYTWCVKNENQMWNYLIDKKLLFSTDYMTINKHINPAPFTSGYPNESPGRASVWLGWQIVKAYMKRNKEISVKELMLNNDYQEILTESRYEP